jgi:LacI family transcriptional regulator
LYFSKLRKEGFYKVMDRLGKPVPSDRYASSGLSEDEGFIVAQKMLQTDPSITSIICANDTLAIGVIQACKQAHREPGKDIAIIGYNNSPQGRYTEPPITTIQHDEALSVGQLLGDMIYKRIKGEPLKNLQRLMPPQWISRHSICKAL